MPNELLYLFKRLRISPDPGYYAIAKLFRDRSRKISLRDFVVVTVSLNECFTTVWSFLTDKTVIKLKGRSMATFLRVVWAPLTRRSELAGRVEENHDRNGYEQDKEWTYQRSLKIPLATDR